MHQALLERFQRHVLLILHDYFPAQVCERQMDALEILPKTLCGCGLGVAWEDLIGGSSPQHWAPFEIL